MLSFTDPFTQQQLDKNQKADSKWKKLRKSNRKISLQLSFFIFGIKYATRGLYFCSTVKTQETVNSFTKTIAFCTFKNPSFFFLCFFSKSEMFLFLFAMRQASRQRKNF